MNNKIVPLIGVAIIILIGVFVYMQKQDKINAPISGTPTATSTATSTATTSSTPSATSGMTMSEVASHNSRTSCWAAINGSVYDLTGWIPKHPGGAGAIAQLCGTDGSAKFNAQHGGSGMVLSVLTGFKIGLLAK